MREGCFFEVSHETEHRSQTRRQQRGFSATDLPVVLAIVAVLAAVVVPMVTRSRSETRLNQCIANLQQINRAVLLYAEEHRGALPFLKQSPQPGGWWPYKEQIKGHLGFSGPPSPNEKVFGCPMDRGYGEGGEKLVPFRTQKKYNYASYNLNSINLPGVPSIAGWPVSAVKEPSRTLLTMEWTAHAPLSWHRSRTGKANTPFYNDAESMAGFLDGHISFIPIYYDGMNAAYTRNPVPEYHHLAGFLARSLPLTPPPPRPYAAAAQQQSIRMANRKILVVEDDPAVADLIVLYLKRSGYEVAGCVATGEDALTEAARARPDLALMDIELQGELDGVQTAGQLRARFNVPVVFLTGLADDETLRRSQGAQAFGYLLKPFRPEDLKASIDLALSKHPVESKLRRIEGWFTAAIKSIGEAVFTTNEESRVTFLNPAAEALTGWTIEEAAGRALGEVFQMDPEGEGRAPNRALLRTRNGTAIPIEWSVAPIRDEPGAVIGRVLIFRDISERERAESALRQSREELRSLAAHLQDVREEERTRIAREVHDELGQMVTGLKMDLSWIEKRLPAIADVAAREPLAAKAAAMSGLLDHMVKTVRKIASDLRPGVLDDLGLLPALDWQARDWQARTGIECQVSASLEGVTISPERGTALFRIFQETLTNVARHAHATMVRARISADGGWLTMEIQDNGRGITSDDRQRAKSFGLLGMNERAMLLGGEFAISGEPGQGTTVRVRIPIGQ